MARILILFAHPTLEKSRIHRRLIGELATLPGVTLNDLYEEYPTFDVDIRREQELLLAHDLIIFQHPLFWYSTPALLKQWQDLVLEHGWAYGSTGDALHGKYLMNVITAGGRAEAYRRDGYNRFTLREFLAPIEQTAFLCGMRYLPPLVFHGTHRMGAHDIDHAAEHYREALLALQQDAFDLDATTEHAYMNDALRIAREQIAGHTMGHGDDR